METDERRQVVWAALAVFGSLAVLIVVAVVFAGGAGDERDTTASTVACASDDTVCRAAQQDEARPGIIPEPGSGHAPTEAGDPGGIAQILVLVGLVVALAVIGLLVARSMRRARAAASP